jgi:cytoskeletal protein RodZ
MMSSPEPFSARPNRRRLWSLLAAAVVAAAVVVAVVLSVGDGASAGSRAAAASTSQTSRTSTASSPASTTTPPTSGPATAAPDNGGQLPASQAPVALTQAASAPSGPTVRLTAVEAIQGTGNGVGNINGPALRVTVEVTNGTASALALSGVQVTMSYTAEETPASPLDDPSGSDMTGDLAPGTSATGVYVFSVPADQRALVTVTVAYAAGAPFLVFSGSAA